MPDEQSNDNGSDSKKDCADNQKQAGVRSVFVLVFFFVVFLF